MKEIKHRIEKEAELRYANVETKEINCIAKTREIGKTENPTIRTAGAGIGATIGSFGGPPGAVIGALIGNIWGTALDMFLSKPI